MERSFYRRNPNGTRTKVIPSNIWDLLTPIGLAYWFQDEGNKTTGCGAIPIYIWAGSVAKFLSFQLFDLMLLDQ